MPAKRHHWCKLEMGIATSPDIIETKASTFKLFICLLAMSIERRGSIDKKRSRASWLTGHLNMTSDEVKEGLEFLSSEDIDMIRMVEGGIVITNYTKYQSSAQKEEIWREQQSNSIVTPLLPPEKKRVEKKKVEKITEEEQKVWDTWQAGKTTIHHKKMKPEDLQAIRNTVKDGWSVETQITAIKAYDTTTDPFWVEFKKGAGAWGLTEFLRIKDCKWVEAFSKQRNEGEEWQYPR